MWKIKTFVCIVFWLIARCNVARFVLCFFDCSYFEYRCIRTNFETFWGEFNWDFRVIIILMNFNLQSSFFHHSTDLFNNKLINNLILRNSRINNLKFIANLHFNLDFDRGFLTLVFLLLLCLLWTFVKCSLNFLAKKI